MTTGSDDPERDAWFEYLGTCLRAIEDGRYPEVEPWAWNRLVEELRGIREVPGSVKVA